MPSELRNAAFASAFDPPAAGAVEGCDTEGTVAEGAIVG